MSVKRVTIKGNAYIIDQLPHSQALGAWVVLMRSLGPAASEILVGSLKGTAPSPADVGKALKDVCLRLDAAELESLSEAFGAFSAVVKGKAKLELNAKNRDAHFKGAIGEWLEWLLECVRHNYADFLELLTSAAPSGDVSPELADKETEAE